MDLVPWLLDSDPAIRWQVLRDVLHAAPELVAAERALTVTHGWGARLLARTPSSRLVRAVTGMLTVAFKPAPFQLVPPLKPDCPLALLSASTPGSARAPVLDKQCDHA